LKIACGTDIIEINRIKDSIEEYGERFLKKIYTEAEINYCESHHNNKYQHYAGRFAAKEALFKAVSSILEVNNLDWNYFEIINDNSGKPKAEINNNRIKSIDISISHSKENAVAMAVVLYE
jgi:holo-[acyl-carrier protein] synthase